MKGNHMEKQMIPANGFIKPDPGDILPEQWIDGDAGSSGIAREYDL